MDINSLVGKYNINNYAFALINYENNKLKIYLKTNFEGNYVSKNFSYELKSLNDEENLNFVVKKLKTATNDLWKESNLVNLLMPLTIKRFSKGNVFRTSPVFPFSLPLIT